MRISRVEKVRRAARNARVGEQQESKVLDLEGLARLVVSGDSARSVLLPTQREFIFSPIRRKWYVGPVGCAKTSSLCASVIIPAMLYPGSRWLVARWTYWTLQETTMKRFYECLERLGPNIIVDKYEGPPHKIWIASARAYPDGSPMEPSEIVFNGLDDIGKLGSTEFNGIAVDEYSEIDKPMAETLDQRLRHRRPDQDRAEGPFFLNGVSNPVNRAHWLHQNFCGESDGAPVTWGTKFKPLPKENEANLPPGYYETISENMSPEMKIRMIEGECGPDPAGQGVFPEFRQSLHVDDFKVLPGRRGIRGWDFGRRRPACVWAQQLANGRVNFLAAELGENEGLPSFIRKVKQRSALQFPEIQEWTDFCDPHGTQRRDTSDETSIDILRKHGIQPKYVDVGIENGLEAMSAGLCKLIDGNPQFMFDRVNAALLIEGLGGGYTWPMPRPGQKMKGTPVADGYYEHPMDAFRYIAVNLEKGSGLNLSAHRKTLRKINSTGS